MKRLSLHPLCFCKLSLEIWYGLESLCRSTEQQWKARVHTTPANSTIHHPHNVHGNSCTSHYLKTLKSHAQLWAQRITSVCRVSLQNEAFPFVFRGIIFCASVSPNNFLCKWLKAPNIGVGAGKFLGLRKNFDRTIFVRQTFPYKFFSQTKNKGLHVSNPLKYLRQKTKLLLVKGPPNKKGLSLSHWAPFFGKKLKFKHIS